MGWENFQIKDYLHNKFNLPAIVNNDANVAGFGEAMDGVAKGCESVYYITLSTGVGDGIVVILKNFDENINIINIALNKNKLIYNLMYIKGEKYMDNSQYVKDYSDNSFFEKIKKTFSKAGVQVVYGALLLFYALKDPAVPEKAKATIVGALGYFITPLI